jgi:hypothetical protein
VTEIALEGAAPHAPLIFQIAVPALDAAFIAAIAEASTSSQAASLSLRAGFGCA